MFSVIDLVFVAACECVFGIPHILVVSSNIVKINFTYFFMICPPIYIIYIEYHFKSIFSIW